MQAVSRRVGHVGGAGDPGERLGIARRRRIDAERAQQLAQIRLGELHASARPRSSLSLLDAERGGQHGIADARLEVLDGDVACRVGHRDPRHTQRQRQVVTVAAGETQRPLAVLEHEPVGLVGMDARAQFQPPDRRVVPGQAQRGLDVERVALPEHARGKVPSIDDVVCACLRVVQPQRRVAEVEPGDAGLGGGGLFGSRRRRGLLEPLDQVGPVVAAVACNREVQREAVHAHRTQLDPSRAQERPQPDAEARPIEGGERLRAESRAVRHGGGTGFDREPGKHRQRKRSVQTQFAAGRSLEGALQFVLVRVGIEQQPRQQQAAGKQCRQ